MTPRLPPGYYAIADADAAGDDVVALARALLAARAPTLQLRMKGRPDDVIRAALRTLAPESAKVGSVLVLNDHPRLAAEFPGVGVHVGQGDVSPEEARAIVGPSVLVGWSTHDVDQVRDASRRPVDYVGFGPIFSAATKHLRADDRRPVDAPRGTLELARAAAAATVPVVAIGGIQREHIAPVLDAGAHAVAVIRAVSAAQDPTAEAIQWRLACRR